MTSRIGISCDVANCMEIFSYSPASGISESYVRNSAKKAGWRPRSTKGKDGKSIKYDLCPAHTDVAMKARA